MSDGKQRLSWEPLRMQLDAVLDVFAKKNDDGSGRPGAGVWFDEFSDGSGNPFYDVTVAALTKVAQFRDTETGEHLVRMRCYAQIIAEELAIGGPYAHQIDEQFLEDLYRASPLHDIGKVGIRDAILLKPARLTPEEFEIMKQHTTIGANILDQIALGAPEVRFFGMAALVALFHHERFDGRGYPAGLHGTETPLPARIVALADAYDAMTSLRPYKAPMSADAAKEAVQTDSGSHFDPVIVEAFLRRFDVVLNVQKRIQDHPQVVIGANSFLPEHPAASSDHSLSGRTSSLCF